MKGKKKNNKKSSPGQMKLPWDEWEANNEEIEKVAEKFIFANCYNPQFVGSVLQNRGAVPGIGKPEPAIIREERGVNKS